MAPAKDMTVVLREAAAAGVRLVQYRDKQASMRQAYERGLVLRAAARETGTCFLVNDRCDLALALEADGVHLGQDDLPIHQARHLLGPEKIIGLSTHSAQQVTAAAQADVDYLGFGPVFPTRSKHDHEPIVGVEGLRAVRPLTTLPLFAIGGITAERYADVLGAGADGAAVISAILQADDIGLAVSAFTTASTSPPPPARS